MLPKTILPLLAVPGTNQAPRLVVESWAGDEPFSGWLLDRNRQVVARLLNYRFRFVGFDVEAETLAAFRCLRPTALAPSPQPVSLPLDSPRLALEGDWAATPGQLHSPGGVGSLLRFTTSAPRVGLRCFAWPHGGLLEVRRDGAVVAELDLYDPVVGLPTGVTIDNPGGGSCEIVLAATGRSDPAAFGCEVRLVGITEDVGPPGLPTPTVPLAPLLAAPPMLAPFMEWVAALPADGLALDIGGPPERQADPRLLQMDWLAFDAPHLLGNPLALPFRDNSLDLVHSNATINHLVDPVGFAREIHRVLKPGGWALVGAMPGHWTRFGAPHLLDLTPAALRRVFAGFGECHLQSGGTLADRALGMISATGVDPAVLSKANYRIRADISLYDPLLPPGAVDALPLWSILQLRK